MIFTAELSLMCSTIEMDLYEFYSRAEPDELSPNDEQLYLEDFAALRMLGSGLLYTNFPHNGNGISPYTNQKNGINQRTWN